MKLYLDRLIAALCVFTFAAGLWLLAMENILRHQGYAGRSITALLIAGQSLATLWWLNEHRAMLRYFVFAGTVAIFCFATTALWNVQNAGHFEGFVIVIATALLAQAVATFTAISRA